MNSPDLIRKLCRIIRVVVLESPLQTRTTGRSTIISDDAAFSLHESQITEWELIITRPTRCHEIEFKKSDPVFTHACLLRLANASIPAHGPRANPPTTSAQPSPPWCTAIHSASGITLFLVAHSGSFVMSRTRASPALSTAGRQRVPPALTTAIAPAAVVSHRGKQQPAQPAVRHRDFARAYTPHTCPTTTGAKPNRRPRRVLWARVSSCDSRSQTIYTLSPPPSVSRRAALARRTDLPHPTRRSQNGRWLESSRGTTHQCPTQRPADEWHSASPNTCGA